MNMGSLSGSGSLLLPSDEDDDEFFDDVVELRREREVFPFGGKRHVIVLTKHGAKEVVFGQYYYY